MVSAAKPTRSPDRPSTDACGQLSTISFREFASSPDFCGIDPSPVIAAIMDAADRLPVTTIDDATCEKHFGCTVADLPRESFFRLVVVRAGGRGGKTSRLLAPKALHAAWTVPAPDLQPGEEAFAFVVAPYTDLADQTFAFVRGYVEASPVLSKALVGEPKARSLRLRRPDGTIACVKVVAAGRSGTQLRARTTIFAGIDEAALFRDRASGVVNDEHIYGAIAPRIIAGGQCWMVSTPWLANVGLIEQTIGREWGTHENALCVVAPTKALRPTFDPDGSIERAERARDPENWEREILAIPLTGGTSAFFSHEAIEAAKHEKRPLKLERREDAVYGSGGDCGFRKNSSALAIVETDSDGSLYRLAAIEELKPQPGLPLKPAGVVDAFASEMDDYGDAFLVVDSHEREEVSLELARHGKSAIDAPDKREAYVLTRKLLHEGKIEIPDHPRLIRQLKDVVAKPLPGGGIQISSPR
ncbi:MAG TPA: hypothetical protein VLT45_24150, partial [Kofleriaceae bacterium]|nr:hypothetical protein [Kofleriaceae bacterium]